ncbi:hypothetical protein GCM10022377_26300 [Zhihengliuella alba]|uniref:HTH tetR-type domain-containing protein n=1 Tax=Zhihengliuella alba TaxID=547018 RepID=A0ABP7DXT3_9MICC
MPKIVDHAARRDEIARAACRVVARRGLDGLTLRDVAAEAGFANGALKPYFPTKTELARATYTYVFEQTNRRIDRSVAGAHGLVALERFAREVLPLDAERLDEARVVLPFWQLALHEPGLAEINDGAMLTWRGRMRSWMREGMEAGEVRPELDVASAVESLLNFLLGAQGAAVLDTSFNSVEDLERQLQVQLGHLRPRARPGP